MKSRSLPEIIKDYGTIPEYLDVEIYNVNTKSRFGDTLLHVACTRGLLSDVVTLVESGADINAIGEHGYTPLHQAVQHGHPDIVGFLLNNGANHTMLNDSGDTPLELARYFGNQAVISLLEQKESS